MVKKMLLGATIALFVLSAQQPTCNKCSASYISSSEVQSYLKRAEDNGAVRASLVGPKIAQSISGKPTSVLERCIAVSSMLPCRIPSPSMIWSARCIT